MAIQEKVLGAVPVPRGEYQEGQSYDKYNIVTLYGCSFWSKIDSNTSVPATISEDKKLVVNSNWSIYSDSFAAYMAGEKFEEQDEKLAELSSKLIKLSAFGAIIQMQIGEIGYNSVSKLIRRKISDNEYETIPYYEGAIYTYKNELYVYNGSELVKTTYNEIQNNKKNTDNIICINSILGELYRIESGTYNNLTGDKISNEERIRTTIFKPPFTSISVNDGFKIVQAFYYSDESWKRTVAINSTKYDINLKDGENCIALSFKSDDTENPTDFKNIEIKTKPNLIDKTNAFEFSVNFESGCYINENGEAIKSSVYAYSDYYSTSGVLEITINLRAQGAAKAIVFLDNLKNVLASYQSNFGVINRIKAADFPEGSAFFRCSKSISSGYKDGYVKYNISTPSYLDYVREKTGNLYNIYANRKLVTVGSSSTEPGEWQKHISKWTGLLFSQKENNTGVGYVRINGKEDYWIGLEYSETLPESTPGKLDVSKNQDGSELINIYTEQNGNIWRKAFQTSKAGDYIKANGKLNILARAFDVKFYKPDVIFIMCYNEINYITDTEPYGQLGTIDDEPCINPLDTASIFASYKGIIEYYLKNIQNVEIILVSTKMNPYNAYGIGENIDINALRASTRWKKDKVYHDAIIKLSNYYHLKYIDLFNNTSINPWNIQKYMKNGGTDVHCNELGQERYIANNIYKKFMS